MLDTKLKGTQHTYCGVIIFSDNIKHWDTVFTQHFSECDQQIRSVNGGHQLVIRDKTSGDIFITASFYLGSNKPMVQPGQRDDVNILQWVKHFHGLMKLSHILMLEWTIYI